MPARGFLRKSLVAAVLVAGIGCLESSVDPSNLPDAAILVINASAAPVDVLIDDELAYPELPASMFTYRIPVRSGPRTVTLRTAAGQTASSAVAVSAWSTVMIAGRTAAGGASLQAQVMPDTNARGVVGQSKLRVAHLAPNAPRIDVWRTQPDYPDPVRVMVPFEYPAVSPYLVSDPGMWRVWATPLASTGVDTVLADTGPLELPGTSLVTVALVDSAGTLRLRVIE